jgi:hypothetical protein
MRLFKTPEAECVLILRWPQVKERSRMFFVAVSAQRLPIACLVAQRWKPHPRFDVVSFEMFGCAA